MSVAGTKTVTKVYNFFTFSNFFFPFADEAGNRIVQNCTAAVMYAVCVLHCMNLLFLFVLVMLQFI